jgi:hypothetical protein
MAQHEAALQQGYGQGGLGHQEGDIGSFNNPGRAAPHGGASYQQGYRQTHGQPYGPQQGGMGAGTAAGMGLAG